MQQKTRHLLRWVLDELDTLLDVALETLVALLQKLLLVVVRALDNVLRLLCTTLAELDWDGEELETGLLDDLVAAWHAWEVDEGGLDDAGLALVGLDDLLGETETGVGHGEGSGTTALLGLNDLVTTELDACIQKSVKLDEGKLAKLTVDESIKLVLWDVDGWLSLREERNDSLAGVTTNHWDLGLRGVLGTGDGLDEGLGTDDVEGGDTEELLCVKLASLLEDLGGNGDGAVDRVGDDEDEGLGAVRDNTLDQALDNASVDLEEVVTGHARLACVYMLSSCYCV